MPSCTWRIGGAARVLTAVLGACVGAVVGLGFAHEAAASGPDVVLYGCTAAANATTTTGVVAPGPLDGKLAYSIESKTCNIGDAIFTWNMSPGYAQNLYRLYNGRLEQIGQSWVKYADEPFSQSGCGTCPKLNMFTPEGLYPGCSDTYTAGYNGQQVHLGPRSGVNAFTGAFAPLPESSAANRLERRIVVPITDVSGTYASAQFFFEGVYVSTEDAAAGNASNNAGYRRATFAPSSYDVTMQDTIQSGKPAILAWKDYGSVGATFYTGTADVPSEGRFHYLCRVQDLGGGTWRYDYAVFNLNSDVSGASFSVPLPAGATPTNVGFHDIDYHSGEIYDNTDWGVSVTANAITWSGTQTYAQNANANALRWGTMYNFWFDLNVAPTAEATGCVTLGLFKPFTPNAIQMAAIVPTSGQTCPALTTPCAADFNGDTVRDVADLFGYINAWLAKTANADFNHDTVVDVADLFGFINAWLAGC